VVVVVRPLGGHGRLARLFRRQHHRRLHLQLRPGALTRACLFRAVPADAAGADLPAPGPVRQAGPVNGRALALAAAFAALGTLPYWMPGIYYINVSSQVLFYSIFALGLNILVGYGGLVSLGHAGLFGITAYATAYLLSMGFGHTTAILGALVIRVGCTAVYAALARRANGIGFIMITLALGQIIWGLAYRWIS